MIIIKFIFLLLHKHIFAPGDRSLNWSRSTRRMLN